MATVSICLEKRFAPHGMRMIRICIHHNQSKTFVGTGVHIREEDFTGNPYDPVRKGTINAPYIKEVVSRMVRQIEAAIFNLSISGELAGATVQHIKIDAFGKKEKKPKVVKEPHTRAATFMGWYDTFIEKHPHEKTKESMRYAGKLLCAFNGQRDGKDGIGCIIQFKEIDYPFLKDFEEWMLKNGKGEHCVHNTMAYIRAAFREAERRKLVSRDLDPFLDYQVKRPAAPEEVNYISEEGFKRLLSLNLDTLQGAATLNRARDVALITFYLCGINLTDIFTLAKPKGDEVIYTRAKIADKRPRPVHIKITPELQVLIDKYKGKDHLFNFCETFRCFDTFQHDLNHRMRRVSKYVGESVTMALMRHTWGTYAAKLGVDIWTIDKSLGHKDNTITSIHYVAYDWSKTNDANRRVIDYATQGVVPNSIPCPAYI